MENIDDIICERLSECIETEKRLLQDREIIRQIKEIANKIVETVRCGGKLLICGNGGSAADASHFAGELVGRFQRERDAWPAIALNADVSTMTAIANDYGYREIFARQVKAFAKRGDLLIGISTSGNSENVFCAVEMANHMGVHTVCLLGGTGGKLANIVETALVVPAKVTARIQETHIVIIHILCEIIEEKLRHI